MIHYYPCILRIYFSKQEHSLHTSLVNIGDLGELCTPKERYCVTEKRNAFDQNNNVISQANKKS